MEVIQPSSGSGSLAYLAFLLPLLPGVYDLLLPFHYQYEQGFFNLLRVFSPSTLNRAASLLAFCIIDIFSRGVRMTLFGIIFILKASLSIYSIKVYLTCSSVWKIKFSYISTMPIFQSNEYQIERLVKFLINMFMERWWWKNFMVIYIQF